ncbi:MAG: hypothetical protein LKH74_10425 [Levilactobacillus sp.]|jgi:hypothetical protein|uniref:hypothetical protein n=1 Tax=Levilactobacillus TaxID=2767886 RepID=UPI0014369CB9|nr:MULTISPECIES: hypothetical protein [Levilactobacillus]MCI1554323.1 hypothetical protein [Levilactobacillus sp.]MCI1598568.1 hypothetical protein [Levilactobacillus sp.]MCI1606816.1 hypothetical protein [Levilactobacillus sp.]
MTKITIQHLTFGFAGTAPLFEHIAPLTLTPLATHYPVLLHVQDLTLQYPGGLN